MMVNQQIEKFEQETSFRNNASLRIARADHVCLGVDDFGTVARWYVEKLGFQLEGQWTIAQAPGMTVGWLIGPGGFGLELIAGGKGARNPVGSKWMEHLMLRGWNHLSFWSEDVDATMAEPLVVKCPLSCRLPSSRKGLRSASLSSRTRKKT